MRAGPIDAELGLARRAEPGALVAAHVLSDVVAVERAAAIPIELVEHLHDSVDVRDRRPRKLRQHVGDKLVSVREGGRTCKGRVDKDLRLRTEAQGRRGMGALPHLSILPLSSISSSAMSSSVTPPCMISAMRYSDIQSSTTATIFPTDRAQTATKKMSSHAT